MGLRYAQAPRAFVRTSVIFTHLVDVFVQYYNLAVRNDFMSWVAPYRYSALHDFKIKVPTNNLPRKISSSLTTNGRLQDQVLDLQSFCSHFGALVDGETLPALAASLVSAQVLYSVRHARP
jgi:hypothetical protein